MCVNLTNACSHEDGLLYRAERLVNWSPHLQTALSDIEVEHIDVAPNSTIKVPGSQRKYPPSLFFPSLTFANAAS